MVNYTFAPQAAIDIGTGNVAFGPNLSGQLYASESDAQSETSPLTVTVAGGVTTTTLTVSSFGQLPEFTVADLYQVWWRSGDVIVHMMSFDGIVEGTENAADSSAASAVSAALSEQRVADLQIWLDRALTLQNVVLDPRATNAGRWAALGGSTATKAMITGATDGPVLPDGTKVTTYARYTISTVGTGNAQYGYDQTAAELLPVVPVGTPLPIAIYVRSSVSVSGVAARKDAYLEGVGAPSSQIGSAVTLPANTWVRLESLVSNNADFDQLRIAANFPQSARSLSQVIEVTAALAAPGSPTIPDHYDGDTPSTDRVGYGWAGLRNASVSKRVDMTSIVRSVNGALPDASGNIQIPLGGGGGTSDHGALSGLADDDHLQYLTLARALLQFWSKAQVDSMVAQAAVQESALDRARGNHTGTQAISSVNGLQAALDSLAAGSIGPTTVQFIIATSDTTPRPPGAGMVIWLDARVDQTNPPTNMGDNDRWSPGGAVPSGDLTAPTIPTLLTKTSITASGFTLGWTASTDNIGVTGYEVRRDGSVSLGVQSGTSRIITGLSPSTSYTFQVRARDAAGNVSTWSDPIEVTTLASSDSTPPTVPTGLASSSITSSGFTVTWGAGTDNVGVTGYDVRINGGSPETVAADPRSKTFTGLTELTAYTVEIRTRDGAGLTSAYVPIVVNTLEGAGETYSVYGAPAPTGSWTWGLDGTPYIVTARGFQCSAAGARVVGGRAWIPTAASGSLPSEATFYLFGPDAGPDSAAVETKVVSTAGATAGSWVEAMFDVPEAMEVGEVWMIGVRFTGAGDAGKYAFGTGTRPNANEVISTGDLGADLVWAAQSGGTANFSSNYKIGTGSAASPGEQTQSYGLDILVDLGA